MDGMHTKMDENNATIFHSYPCFHHQWQFSQEFPMCLWHTKRDENL